MRELEDLKKQFGEHTWDVIQGLDDLAHRRLYSKGPDGTYEKILGYGMRDKEYTCYCDLLKKRNL